MNKNKESDSQLLSSEMSEITFETLESILESDVFKSIPIVREILGAFKERYGAECTSFLWNRVRLKWKKSALRFLEAT